MKAVRIATLACLAALVVGAHAALWASEAWSVEAKLRLTILNALAWAVVVLPALAVGRWAALHRGPETTPDCPEATHPRNGS